MNFEVYTLGGGEFLISFFNAIALVMRSREYMGIIHTIVIIGLLIQVFKLAGTGNYIEPIKWASSIYLVFSIAVIPKVSVYINDKANIGITGTPVSNIPIGLAITASVASKIDKVLTETFDMSFSLPDDLTYSNSGMLFGNQLIDTIIKSKIRAGNSPFKRDVNEFIRRCIYDQVLLGNITPESLKNEKELKNLLFNADNNSDILHVKQSTGLISCKQAARDLKAVFNSTSTIENLAAILKPESHNANPTANTNNIMTKLNEGAEYFIKAGTDARDLIEQTMMIDSLLSGMDTRASLSDSENTFAKVKTRLQTREGWKVIGANAPQYATMLKMFIQAILYAIFPLLIILIMSGMIGANIFIEYGKALLGLAFIGPLWAIVHRLSSGITAFALSSQIRSTDTIVLANIVKIQEINSDIMAFAGYLSIMVIPLAFSLSTKGIMAVTGNLSSMMSGMSGNANLISGEAVSGNYSIGNTSYGNSNYNNTSANKHDTSTLHRHGFTAIEDAKKSVTIDNKGGEITQYQYKRSDLGYDEMRNIEEYKGESSAQNITGIERIAKNESQEILAAKSNEATIGLNVGGGGKGSGGGILSAVASAIGLHVGGSGQVNVGNTKKEDVNHSDDLSTTKTFNKESGYRESITIQDRFADNQRQLDIINKKARELGRVPEPEEVYTAIKAHTFPSQYSKENFNKELTEKAQNLSMQFQDNKAALQKKYDKDDEYDMIYNIVGKPSEEFSNHIKKTNKQE